MPDFAVVQGDVLCYRCSYKLSDHLAIQWGEVPNLYSIGDSVKWLHRNGAIATPFRLYRGRSSWNCGDPALSHVMAFDGDSFVIERGKSRACSNCMAGIGGAAVEINNGKLSRTITYSEADVNGIFGDAVGKADIVVIEIDGKLSPRCDWFDPTVHYLDEC
jgi:hypothetical protein